MPSSGMFDDYCKEVAKLRFIKPENYGENKRKAFFINIYNSLTIHATVFQASAGNLPDSPMKVKIYLWERNLISLFGETLLKGERVLEDSCLQYWRPGLQFG